MFHQYDAGRLEELINEWLSDNLNKMTVYHKHTRFSSFGDKYNSHFSAMFVYDDDMTLH